MNIKFVTSHSDKNTYESYVVLKYKGKTYTGWSRFNAEEEDPANWSEYIGCGYAEMRATRKIYKELLAEKKQQRKGVQDLYNMLLGCKSCSVDSFEMKRVRQYLQILDVQIKRLKNMIRWFSEENIKLLDANRADYREHIAKLKEQEKKITK